jgi:hypothetical protein
MMKRSLIFIAVIALLSLPCFAQKGKPAPSRSPKIAEPAKTDNKLEATQIAETVKAFSRFIYIYGKVMNGLEFADEQAKKSKPTASVLEKNAELKSRVVGGVSGLKDQIEKLGVVLQANPKLQVQFVNLAGVTQKISEAIQLLDANQYDPAGRSLVTASERLTDILLQTR